jgi:hypothetical protein
LRRLGLRRRRWGSLLARSSLGLGWTALRRGGFRPLAPIAGIHFRNQLCFFRRLEIFWL